MIRWDLTKKTLGISKSNARKLDWVIVKCDCCSVQAKRRYAQHEQTMKKNGRYLCRNCSTKSPEFRQACSQRAKQKWEDEKYRAHNLEATHFKSHKKKLSESIKEAWESEARRALVAERVREQWKDEEYRNKAIKAFRRSWNEERRAAASKRSKEQWQNDEYRNKIKCSAKVTSKKMWERDRDKLMAIFRSEEFKNKMQEVCSNRDSGVLQKISTASKKMWDDDEYRNKMIAIMASDKFRQKMSVAIKNSSKVLAYLDYIRNYYCKRFKDAGKTLNPNYSYQLVDYKNSKINVKIICDIHGVFEQIPNNHISKMNRCPRCAQSYNRSQGEVLDFVKSLGYDVVFNDRTQIYPLELDIYMPVCNSAIEYHGLYWHSYAALETAKEKCKHMEKQTLCEQKGIRLIQIFENEWRDKQEIIKSMIRNKFSMSDRIYARKCEIRTISPHEHVEFMNQNHIQGGKGCNVAYGLEYGDKLVAVMSFNKHPKYGWEITRFANKLHVVVVGGASRLFKKFIDGHKPNTVMTFADRRYSNGNLYRRLRFRLEEITSPNYFYVKNNKIYSRQQFMKHKLKDKLEVFDPSLTEAENMFNNGYRRIWDAGHLKFLWFNQK